VSGGSINTDFSKAFDKVRHRLLMGKMSTNVEPSHCPWLSSCFSSRIPACKFGLFWSHGSHLLPLCFIWFVNEICWIFRHMRVFFYADDMKLFLPVRGFRDCLKIQNDLKRVAEWCEVNALELNVASVSVNQSHSQDCVILLNFRIHGGIILDRVDSINDLGVILDSKRWLLLGILMLQLEELWQCLRLLKRLSLSCKFRDPYTFKTLHVSLVRPKLENASWVWRCFYGAHIDRIEREQRKFVRYALRGLR
jgi:hypothetical protein